MRKKIRRLMAYIYMPLIFVIIGYGIIYVALTPFIEIGYAVFSMVISDSTPTFESNLSSIFNVDPPNDTEETEVLQEDTTEEKTDTVNMADVVIPEYETHYANMTSARINLSTPVYYGDSDEALRYGAGQYFGSSLPGMGGTILVAAHNTTYFLPLKDIEVGDVIQMMTNYGTYEYQVTETKVLQHDDPSAFDLLQKEKEVLVLYTCYPFDRINGIKKERLFVYADKISGPDVSEE